MYRQPFQLEMVSHSANTGGPTYLAIAILRLAPGSPECLCESEKRQTLRWLLQNQDKSGGFSGRTNKDADACYCFWCGSAIKVSPYIPSSRPPFINLPDRCLVQQSSWITSPSLRSSGTANLNMVALLKHRENTQVYFWCILLAGDSEGTLPDPYHTYLSLAAISMFPPPEAAGGDTWAIEPLDPLINAKLSTAQWARDHIPSKKST